MNTISDQNSSVLSVGFCGSGEYSVRCADALATNEKFQISWVVTPPPRPAGRGKKLQASALQLWAEERQIPVSQVESGLGALRPTLHELPKIQYLLVVSFGYLIPEWLLELPEIAPVNVHPSTLPQYRGSSPGQFALLYGETESSVSIMTMNAKFDEGAIITRLPFSLEATETQTSYYDRAFELASQKLATTLLEYSETRHVTPQPEPPENAVLARRLSREDGFLPYEFLQKAQEIGSQVAREHVTSELSPAVQELIQHQPNLTLAETVDRAVRALTPWPGVWTIVPSYKDKTNVRLKIWETAITPQGNAKLVALQYEGEPKKTQ